MEIRNATARLESETDAGGAGDAAIKCTICPQKFANLQECLKHELLEHNEKKKRPQKSMRSKLITILKSFKQDEKLKWSTKICNALRTCKPGEELEVILMHNRMNVENLELIYMRIYKCLHQELKSIGKVTINPFGSIASGLALRDSDIDLYIEKVNDSNNRNERTTLPIPKPRSSQHTMIFNRVNNLLHHSQCFENVIPIRNARVPIIKCKHQGTGFSLDINLSCPNSVFNTNFVRSLTQFDDRLHELLLFLKIWAKHLQLIGRGNMTSYCLITLIIFYLQQPSPQTSATPIIPSLEQLQKNATPNCLQGVNYAYDFNASMQPLPVDISVRDLIKGFFTFYKDFAFDQFMVAPYLGKAVSLKAFKTGEYKYHAYENQQRAIGILNGTPAMSLQADRCMCVQDPFCLNHNVAKSMFPPNLEYFRSCMQHAHRIFNDATLCNNDAKLYEALLFDIVERIAQETDCNNQPAVTAATESMSQSNGHKLGELSCCFVPGRAELRALAAHTRTNSASDDSNTLYHLWVQHYSEAIKTVITEIYRLDMHIVSPKHNDKHQRLENSELTRTWHISGSVDVWTGRLHQRNNGQTFMDSQLRQTEQFLRERRQNANYAVQLSCMMTLSIICNYTAIEVTFTQGKTEAATFALTKKDPLRKFFAMFRCSMQTFSLKEKLDAAQISKTVNSEAVTSKKNAP